MNWGRKGALLMLAVVVLWTALPASACLLAVHSAGHADCCHSLVRECGSPSMCANALCCQTHRQNDAASAVPVYSAQQSQKASFVPQQAGLQFRAASDAGTRPAFEAPPPKFQPDGAFALRI